MASVQGRVNVVGSAIVNLVERHAGTGELLSQVGDFIAALKAPLRQANA